MQQIDLTNYVVARSGAWFESKDHFTAGALTLADPADTVTLAGPLRVRVSVQGQNAFSVIGTSVLSTQAKELFGYVLDIPPGQTWSYPQLPFLLRDVAIGTAGVQPTMLAAAAPGAERAPAPEGGREGAAAAAPATRGFAELADIQRATLNPILRRLVPGVNDRLIVVIRPAGPDACADPCAPAPAPAGGRRGCGCGKASCGCGGSASDLGCDVAVANVPDMGVFFPAACEPCTPGASVGMPALKGPSLIVPPARGGTVRTRFFNGMFMTSEDLETDQRNVRLKRALMNRALGQGVVWGLGVALDGEAVCVLPGYGVDCCGNDIVVTSPYRVDASALVRDPAAAALLATRKPQHLSLVLEYFECPESPRPVHGDPCAADVTRCETSRIRETARLRLAAPCEVDDSGPVKEFLGEIEKLKQDPQIGPLLAPPTSSQPSAAPTPRVPFRVTVQLLPAQAGAGSIGIDPGLATDAEARRRADGVLSGQETSCLITLTAAPGFQFAGGTLAKILTREGNATKPIDVPITSAAGPLQLVTNTPTVRAWRDAMEPPLPLHDTNVEPIPAGCAYRLQDWRMKDASGHELAASHTDVQLTVLRASQWAETPWGEAHPEAIPANASLALHLQAPPGEVAIVGRPPRIPCFSDPCDPERPRFRVTPPWLHEDPARPGAAADPRVLVLAILYSWLAIEMRRSGVGTSQPMNTARLQVAVAIYHAAWRLFYATAPDTQRFALTDALQRLLRAWCSALLYPGPTCHCTPHGVVIGCASVAGGQLQSVDPWGGRRWVVHYPLLSYWGQQFGVEPLDAIASRVFGLICCIAGLPAPRLPVGRTDVVGIAPNVAVGSAGPASGRQSEVNLGRALLILAPPGDAAKRIEALGLRPARTVGLSPFDFVFRFDEALGGEAGPTDERRPLVHYTVLGLPEFHLVGPGDPEAAAPAPVPEPGRLRDLVRAAIDRRPARAAPVPALLRMLTEDLARNVVARVALDAGEPLAAPLADAGITTVGALLGRAPEAVHQDVLKGEHAAAFAALLERTESGAAAAAKGIADAVVTVGTERRLFTRADFKSADAALDLGRRVQEKLESLKLKVPGGDLHDIVVETAGG